MITKKFKIMKELHIVSTKDRTNKNEMSLENNVNVNIINQDKKGAF